MRPLLQIKLPREPRGGVTAASGTVICPPRAARVYTYIYIYTREGERALSLSLSLVKNGRGTRCPSPWIQDLWLSCYDNVAAIFTGSDQLSVKIELRNSIFIDDTNRYLSLPTAISLYPVVSCVPRRIERVGYGTRLWAAKCRENLIDNFVERKADFFFSFFFLGGILYPCTRRFDGKLALGISFL